MASCKAASAGASRLKRRMSRSMRQKSGRARLARWPNTVLRLVPDHSSAGLSSFTLKDMSLATVSTPSWWNRPVSSG
jgi:hypothetical protein